MTPVRAAKATLLALDGQRVAIVSMVVAGDVPPIVMFAGEPFAQRGDKASADLVYRQQRVYRADCSMTVDLRRHT